MRRIGIACVTLATAAVVATAVSCSSTKSAARPTASPSSSVTTTSTPDPAYAPGRHEVSFVIDGVTRTAVLVVPDDLTHPAPLVFAFHGHGGSGAAFDRRVDLDGSWPEAIVVYPDGLSGHEGITDPNGELPGWQTRPGELGDRDVAFYDAMLTTLQSKLPVDSRRIYAMGHSNGSAFTSLLLNRRGDRIAATANLSAQPGPGLLAGDPVRPMFMAMGMQDQVVPYDMQRQSIPLVEAKLGVDLSTATTSGYLRSETGPDGIELETYIHPGGHDVPDEIPTLVVEFFKRHALPAS